MWRLILAVGLLLTAVVSDSQAGYWIVRVLVGGAGGPGAEPGPAAPPIAGVGGRKGGRPGGPGAPAGPGEGRPAGPMPGGAAAGMTDQDPGDPTRSVVVVVPFVKHPNPKLSNPGQHNFYSKELKPPGSWNVTWKLGLKHEFGYTNFLEAFPIERYGEFANKPVLGETYESLVREKHEKYAAAKKNNKPADPNLLYEALTGALDHGMPGEAFAYANELLAASKADGANLSENAKKFLMAYEVVQPKLGVRPRVDPKATDPAGNWLGTLQQLAGNPKLLASEHYAVVYWGDQDEAARRARQLNDNLKAFYLWHCNRGVVLPVPTRPLVAVVLPDVTNLRSMTQAVMDLTENAFAMGSPQGGELARAPDGWHLINLGFYAPDHDILVLSPHRGDNVAVTFRKQNQTNIYTDAKRETLLQGGGPALPEPPDKSTKESVNENPAAYEVARKQTIALVDRVMQHESEVAGVSREGSRQLFYETGLLPRHVALPQWLQTGSAQFFTRPVGPVYTTGDDGVTRMYVALTTGYTRPNFVMQKYFREMPGRKELTTDPEKLLRNVLTDAYFHAMSDGDELDAPPAAKKKPAAAAPSGPGGPGAAAVATPEDDEAAERRQKEERMSLKAQATAWALFYYLYRERPDEFRKYSEELSKLPRDLPLDEKTAVEVFARAFNLGDEPGKTPFKAFAATWQTAVNGVAPSGVEVTLRKPEPPKEPTPGTPAGPGPGAPRGPGGSGS